MFSNQMLIQIKIGVIGGIKIGLCNSNTKSGEISPLFYL